MITEIQRFSLSDGPGIRTVVFFKGCNMKCSWCHNPETILKSPELHFYESKCIGCKKCFEACAQKAHIIVDGVHKIDRNLCISCGKCANVCYAEALVMSGKIYTADEVLNEILQDKEYYKDSGGGVTISGGEVLCQKDFALEIINKCRENNISVAIETNLYGQFDNISDVLCSVDLIMCDIKLMDDIKHIKYTGVSNKKILENIKKIDDLGIPIIIRTPLIPSVTDDENNIISIINYIKPLKHLVRYELLNFNPLGSTKYKSIDKENKFEKCMPLLKPRLDKIEELLLKLDINAKVI